MEKPEHTTATSPPPRDARDANLREITAAVGADAPPPLRVMLDHTHRMRYEPHQILYHQGSPTDCVTFITSGMLKLIVHLPNGRARIVRLHRPGSVLGLSGLRDCSHEHTAMALTPVTALRLPLAAIRRLRTDDPEAYISLIERWHDYLHDADIWITQFSTGPIRARVARLLSFLTEFNDEATGDQLQLLTCEEMGSVLGVTTESTSRILAEFKRAHILTTCGNRSPETYHANLGRLQHIAEQA
jgi:CRP/FNR family transcriptional regulator